MVKSLQELKNMAQIGGRHTWRLRLLTEEEVIAAEADMAEGADSFEKALLSLSEGDREAAVTALHQVIRRATSAIEKIDK